MPFSELEEDKVVQNVVVAAVLFEEVVVTGVDLICLRKIVNSVDLASYLVVILCEIAVEITITK